MASTTVLLVNPNRMQPPIGPIGLDYLGDALSGAGHNVTLLDLAWAADYGAAIDECFRQSDPDLVGVTIRNTDDCYFASRESFLPLHQDVIARLRLHTSAPIILGGVGFSIMPEAVLRRCGGDAGVVGDGEGPIVTIADRVARGENWYDVSGLVYLHSGGFQRNRQAPVTLDDFSRRRALVDNRAYLDKGGMGNVETKRGCGQRCIYCADPLSKGKRYRLRSPELVVEELRLLLDKGVEWLHFCDAEFNLPVEHAENVCAAIIDQGLGARLHWYTYASPRPFSDRLALLMRKAGCEGINFGVDSGNDTMLKRLGRGFSKDDLRQTASSCRRQGLTFMYDLLLGGPGETKETMRETIDLMREVNPSRVGAAVGVRIYPDTALAKHVAADFHTGNRELYGSIAGNEDFAEPVFFLSEEVGENGIDAVRQWVAGDPRFFLGEKKDEHEANYNYNDNSVLVNAIAAGYRGAYWDILRRVNTS